MGEGFQRNPLPWAICLALAAGVFGVPTIVASGEIFWGQDATDMFLDWLKEPQRFAKGEFARIQELPFGAHR